MISNPSLPRFHSMNRFETVVPSGAVGWVLTDLSATLPLVTNRLYYGYLTSTVPGTTVGIRMPGDAAQPLADAWNFIPFLVHTNAFAAVEIYRAAAANNAVEIMGYIEGII